MSKPDAPNENIYNADVFRILVEYEITRSQRYPSPLALIEIEMRFASSQENARMTANEFFLSKLSHHLRSVDIPSRTGNTFKALLPTTNESGARAVCERLLSVFKNKFNMPDGSSIAFSLQIGVAVHEGGATLSSEELFQKAEEALKQSKSKGTGTYVLL